MSDYLQKIFDKKIIQITFERNMGLFAATTIGVGALMGAGVYVLIGLAAGAAGPSVWISYLICGGLAFLTTLMFAELASMNPASGGGYAYAYETLGSLGGFVTGWFLAWGSIFACGLYAIGFAEYFISFFGVQTPPFFSKIVAVFLVIGFTALNTRGSESGKHMQSILTWGNLLILALLISFSFSEWGTVSTTPLFPKGILGTGEAISIIYISFFGYQLIANNADEIIDPTRTVPRAMILAMAISFTFYMVIAVVAVNVVPWEDLAASKAPLLLIAEKSFGGMGWIVIGIGGVLASAGALNSTLLSQGRQIYAMGKHGFLPKTLGRIHEATKIPQAAIMAGGLCIIASLLLFDLKFIAKAANFSLLVSLIPVSLALRKIYKSGQGKNAQATKKKRSKFKQNLPELTLGANLILLATLDLESLMMGAQLGIIGAAIYWFYSRKREQRSSSGTNIVLSEEKAPSLSKGRRVLIPMANPQTQQAMFTISNALLHKDGGEIVVLSVVNVPAQMEVHSAFKDADYSLDILKRTTKMAENSRIPVRPVIRAARDLPKGIVHAAEEEQCSLIIMGYAGDNAMKSANLMAKVLHRAHTDIIFFKLKNLDKGFKPKRIAVSLGGRVNLNLMVELAGALADYFKGKITFLNILPSSYTREQKAYTDKTFMDAIGEHQAKALYSMEALTSDNPLETLLERSRDFDLMIVGTAKVGVLESAIVGEFSTQIAERSECSIAIVRVVSTAKKIIQKI